MFILDAVMHPENSAYKALTPTIPTGGSARINWIKGGTPSFQDVTDADSGVPIVTDADEFGDVSTAWLDITS